MNLCCRLILMHLVLCWPLVAAADATTASEVAVHLQRLSTMRVLGDEPLRAGRALDSFYRQREFQPAWSNGAQLLPMAEELIAELPAAADEGLNPRHYHYPALSEQREQFRMAPSPELAAELDLLLSDAFLSLGSHYRNGRINPTTIDRDWHLHAAKGDPVRMLQQALKSGRIHDSLRALLPTHPDYAVLRSTYQAYRQLVADGGWPLLKIKTPLREGDQGPDVIALRERLVLGNDLSATTPNASGFDPELDTAVRRFQSRHSLEIDGVVGAQTLAALNVPATFRLRQLALNLERWRWLPRQFGPRYVMINLPAFELKLIEEDRPQLSMRGIIGRPLRHTPVFSAYLTSLVLNPSWEVPRHIAIADLLPRIQQDAGYLTENGFRVFDRKGGKEIDPATIDWQLLTPAVFPFRLRQDPGPLNALGRFKFILPNPYTIFLHDTPSPELFKRDRRSFSSGCIRIEQPFELAVQLLQGTPLATRAALETALQAGDNQWIGLPQPLPVYLLYWTAAVDDQGLLHFYPDLYRRDPALAAALQREL